LRPDQTTGQPPPDDPREFEQVPQTVLEHVLDDGEIDVVSVNEDVARSHHPAKDPGQIGPEPSRTLEQVEELLVYARLSESLVGNDVGGNVQAARLREPSPNRRRPGRRSAEAS
jgi:hypothetical protein